MPLSCTLSVATFQLSTLKLYFRSQALLVSLRLSCRIALMTRLPCCPCCSSGRPPEVKSRLEASGFTTLGLLGHALPSADKEDSFIITVLGLDPNNPALLHSAAP